MTESLPDPGTGPHAGSRDAQRVRQAAVTLAAIAQTGLNYTTNDFDVERYAKVRDLAAELLGVVSGHPVASLSLDLALEVGHATPRVDVRGAVFDAGERVLLVQERTDALWALPGGWADPTDTPAGAVAREIHEETGYSATVVKLAACWDRDTQGHVPALTRSVYKLFFVCTVAAESVPPSPLETLDVGWFALDALPPLSTGRVLAPQLRRLLDHHRDPALPADFD